MQGRNNYLHNFLLRSVVVVCKNMNASDVQKLVPSLALSGCFNQTTATANGTNSGLNNSGKCVQLKGNFLTEKKHQKELSSSNDSGCIGEKELCNKITTVTSQSDTSTKKYGLIPKNKNNKQKPDRYTRNCSIGDVTCTLLEKVRWYLKQHYVQNSKLKSSNTALLTNGRKTENRSPTTTRPRDMQV